MVALLYGGIADEVEAEPVCSVPVIEAVELDCGMVVVVVPLPLCVAVVVELPVGVVDSCFGSSVP